jgi:hypothetical protein
MKLKELASIIKKASNCTGKSAEKENKGDKKAEKCAYPKCDCEGTCKITGDKIEKSATDLFGQPVKESMDDKKQTAKASPDASDNPKGLPARPNNSNEKEAEADTADIKVPDQSNDAVTGNGDGPEL